MDVMKDVIEL